MVIQPYSHSSASVWQTRVLLCFFILKKMEPYIAFFSTYKVITPTIIKPHLFFLNCLIVSLYPDAITLQISDSISKFAGSKIQFIILCAIFGGNNICFHTRPIKSKKRPPYLQLQSIFSTFYTGLILCHHKIICQKLPHLFIKANKKCQVRLQTNKTAL